ncbi:MAG TPA: EAL domain-containing protein [Candidatus Limnocylindrales bacterium]|nr:EAL domain-containing protein [Candidatus Limnocylindrales bacterium]
MDRERSGTILVVDDQEDVRRLLVLALRRHDFEVLEAATGETALEILLAQPIDVLVLDMHLPGMSGTAVVQALRLRPETATLPVLLMTGSGTDQSVIEGLDAGADDFLAKPVRLDELVARVRAHLRSRAAWAGLVEEELRVRTSVVGALSRMALSSDPESAAEAVVSELARRTESAFIEVLQLTSGDRLQPMATYSRASGVIRGGPPPNPRRASFLRVRARQGPWVDRPVREATDHDGPIWSEGLGLVAGAPIYSDETVVGLLLIGVSDEAMGSFHDRPAKLMAAAIDYASILTAVAGSALADRRETSAEEARLKQVLDGQAFHVVFQPIVDLETRDVVGYEALTRFTDGTPPNVRFADATRLGLGDDFELAAIGKAMEEAARLPAGAFLSLNVSPAVALASGRRLREHLDGAGRQIVLELTEHVPIVDYMPLRAAIDSLGAVQIAVDDAGAGYASLRHILELRPAFAKLDISLVRGIDSDELRQAMAAGMQYYALRTGCRLVAEGVETVEEANTLRALGVDLGQGYLFGRPERLSG